MEIPSEVLVYFDQLAGEPRHGRLLAIGHTHYEINLQLASGRRRALVPIARTFVVSVEPEDVGEEPPNIER